MRAALVSCLLLSLPAAAQSRAASAACKDVCQKYLGTPHLRASQCGRCFTDVDRGGWASTLTDDAVATQVQGDRDWAVRWGATRARAAIHKVTELRELSTWIMGSKGESQLDACNTAVHVAGSKKTTTGPLLTSGGANGPAAAAKCWEKRVELTRGLQLQMYDESAAVRREAVLHVSAFLEQPPARLVLDAMKDRPPESDDISAELLLELARANASSGKPAGRLLLEGASGVSWAPPLVDRLLAVYAKKVDAVRPQLASAEKNVRREAIAQLSDLGPLGAVELEGALTDVDVANRFAAAKALARGEAVSLGQLATQKLDPAATLPVDTRLRWVGYLGLSKDATCRDALKKVIDEPRHDDAVRGAALPALADCAGLKALPEVRLALKDENATIRAGAADALGNLPRLPDASEELDPAFRDAAPKVLCAAAKAASVHRLERRVADTLQLLNHGDAMVRGCAVQALAVWERSAFAGPFARLYAIEPDAEVRVQVVKALGSIGGPQAMNPLLAAAEKDADARVKLAAKESLRKLGLSRP